jgi:hypothetical protein
MKLFRKQKKGTVYKEILKFLEIDPILIYLARFNNTK